MRNLNHPEEKTVFVCFCRSGRNNYARALWEMEASGLVDGFGRESFVAGLSQRQRSAIGVPAEAGARM
jgi:hypothetical protein